MSVFHILKDGSRPVDITGHIVRLDDVNPLYQLLSNLNRNEFGKRKSKNTYKKEKNEVVK